MSTIADLVIGLSVKDDASKALHGFGAKTSSMVKGALLPATAALGVMGVVGKAAFSNLQDGAQNAKQTETVLKSTGGAAHVTAKHVDDLAMSLRRKAGVDDDVVHSGENMLLTFTNVQNGVGRGNDIFDQATKTMLDMSHALGQDTKSSAIQLGKALNDPIKGVTALQRVGVSFTDAQKKQIKTLVDSGHTMAAQKLILHELNKEFGGSAENIDPTTKAIANMKLDAVDLASSLLQNLMPTLRVMVGVLQSVTGFMTEHGTATKIVVGAIAALSVGVIAANAAMKLYAAGQLVVKAATAAWTGVQWLLNAALAANPIGIVILALVALGVALAIAWAKSDTFRKVVTEAWNAVKSTTLSVFNAIKAFFSEWWPLVLGIATGGLGLVVALVVTKWGAIKSTTSSVWNTLSGIVSGAVSAVHAAAVGGFNAVESGVTGAVNRVRSVVSSVFNGLAGIVKAAVGAVSAGVGALVAAFSPILSALGSIESAAGSAVSAIDRVVGAASKVASIGGAVGHAVGSLIPGHANGGAGSGLSLVGERGPELVDLGASSRVYTNADTRGLLSGAGGDGGDVVLIVDGQVLGRVARKELTRTGKRNVGLTFGSA